MITGFDAAAALNVLLGLEAKALLVLGSAAVAALALRRSSAAARHLAWTAGVLGVLALPVISAALPRLPVLLPGWSGEPSAPSPALPPVASTADESAEIVDFGPAAAPTAAAAEPPPPTTTQSEAASPELSAAAAAPSRAAVPPAAALLALWAAGAVLLLASLGRSMLRVRGLRRRAAAFPPSGLQALARDLSRELGLARAPDLLDGGEGAMPLVCGILRPAVLLPGEAARWPVAHARAVLLHELAHVRRRDLLVQLAAAVTRAVHWPNPLAWLAARRLTVERERACDDRVLAAGSRPSEYATQLLELARSLRTSPVTSRAALAMARPNQLSERVLALLDERCPRGAPSRRALAGSAAVAGLLLLPLAAAVPAPPREPAPPLEPVTAAQPHVMSAWPGDLAAASSAAPARPVPGTRGSSEVFPALALAVPASQAALALRVPALAQVPPADQPCRGDGKSESINHQSNDDSHRFTWKSGDCQVDIRIEGELKFTEDLTGIASISNGGHFRAEERDGGTRRRLEVEPDRRGALSYDWQVNGDPRPFDAEGRAWLSDVLLWLFRDMAFAAEERVAHLLRSGGADAVLAELEHIRSDYGRSVYLRHLMRQTQLEPPQVRRAVALAGAMDSDHYRAEVLGAVARSYALDSQMADGFVAAARGMDSDHYRAEVLRLALGSERLSPGTTVSLLEATQTMDSDHYRSEVLKAAAAGHPFDAAMRAAFLQSSLEMDSDHYRDESLRALLARGEVSAADARMILAAARRMDSDHYRSETLRRIPPALLVGAEVQQAFAQAAGEMDSDHYKSEVLRRLVQRPDVAPEVLGMVLSTAATVDSDHYRAELLKEVAQRHPLPDGPLLDAFMRAADGIGSSHHYGEVLSVLRRRAAGR